MVKKVIFIGGSPYSGSTMLDMMLSGGSLGFSVGEVVALFHPYRSHHINPQCGCGSSDCDFWQQIKTKGAANFYEEIFNRYPQTHYIVDSSKEPSWIASQAKMLKRKGIDALHVLIWKSPLEFASSRLKRGKIENWERDWSDYHEQYSSLVDNWFSIKYSDLAKKPKESLEKLCQDLEIDYIEGSEEYWKHTHHTLFGNSSAKIHLYSKTSNSYDNCDAEISEKTELSTPSSEKHRTIYYDEDVEKELPDKITKHGFQDHRTDLTVELLRASAAGLDRDEKRIAELRGIIAVPFYTRILLRSHNLKRKLRSRIYAIRHQSRSVTSS